jgi:hypothetical protein
MAVKAAEKKDDTEVEYELITSARQLASPPALRKEEVKVPDWPTTSGKGARFLVWEMTAADWAEFMEAGRVYSKEGNFLRYDTKDEDMRFLAYSIRDQHGNRIWPTVPAASGVLGSVGKAVVNLLLTAANKVNRARSAEGNSEETQIASSLST